MEESSRPKILRSYRQNSHELLLIWFRCQVNTKTVIFLWICDLGTCLVSFPLSSQYIIKLVSDLCVFNFRSKTFLTAKMPNIVYDVKLDFKDVLLRPKRSTLKSRADVDLYREITFRNSKQTYNGIPIMASNMDTVGTFEMAKTLAKVFRRHIFSFVHSHWHWCLIRTYRVTHKSFRKWSSVQCAFSDNVSVRLHSWLQHGCFTCMHKFYSPEEYAQFARENPAAIKVS